MRVVVVGLGIQGRKRLAVAGPEAVATVDPAQSEARYRSVTSSWSTCSRTVSTCWWRSRS